MQHRARAIHPTRSICICLCWPRTCCSASFTRSAKSGSDWSKNELLAYNITISPVPPEQFFRSGPDPPLDHLDSAILTAPPGADDPSISDVVAGYLAYLDLATNPTQESSTVDFATETLKLLGFDERNTVISMRYTIPLTICGDSSRIAQADVCLLHRSSLVLLVLVLNRTDAESQVVAEAIAAFQFNNRKREGKGHPRLDAMTIPCITMSGTRPTFYLVPVTEELSTAVITGQYPATETRVLKCVTVAAHTRRAGEGMENTEYRTLALKRFLAFKTLAKSHWVKNLDGL